MKNKRKLLKVMFCEVDFSRLCHSVSNLQDDKFKSLCLEYAFRVFQGYSTREIKIIFNSIWEEDSSPFKTIIQISDEYLEIVNDKVLVQNEKLFKWRDISLFLSEDIFKCALIAGCTNKKSREKLLIHNLVQCTSYKPTHNLFNSIDYTDNHLHYGGLAGGYEYNWLGLMNHYLGLRYGLSSMEDSIREKETLFNRWEDDRTAIQDRINIKLSDQIDWRLRDKIILAAMYRLYIFTILWNKKPKKISDIIKKYENSTDVSQRNSLKIELVDLLSIQLENADIRIREKISDELLTKVLDLSYMEYALLLLSDSNSISGMKDYDIVILGEQLLLEKSFERIFEDTACIDFQFIFFKYLLLRTQYRSEFILLNGRSGLDNFKIYVENSLRKTGDFLTKYKRYSNLQTDFGLGKVFSDEKIAALELRVAVGNESQKISNFAYENGTNNVYLVASFKKQAEKYNSKLVFQYRYKTNRKHADKVIIKIIDALDQYDNQKKVDSEISSGQIFLPIKGIDTCSGELDCRPEVFAPYYRFFLHDERMLSRNILATYHVGEEFLDITDGLRAIDEILYYFGYKKGCRIGHGIVLGINALEFYNKKHRLITITKQALLDNLFWLKKRLNISSADSNWKKINADKLINDLFCEIYNDCYDEQNYYHAWLMRGDRIDDVDDLVNINAWNINNLSVEDDLDWTTVRNDAKAKKILTAYAEDTECILKGEKYIEFEVTDVYISYVEEAQRNMIRRLIEKEIAVEANPTSNLLIGTFDEYENHPIFYLKDCGLSVSINTDDPGILNTTIENELQLMYTASISKVENPDKWINSIIEDGIKQSWKDE